MKKLFLLFAVIFLGSCTTEDLDLFYPNYNDQNSVNPPSWLLGTWHDNRGNEFRFTQYDVDYRFGNSTYSANDEILYFSENYGNPEVFEYKDSDTYTLSYYYSEFSKMKFNFSRISNNKMESNGFISGTFIKD